MTSPTPAQAPGRGVPRFSPVNEPWDEYDPDFDEGDEEEDREADCGRWINGRLTAQCRLAGTEWCDWECPIGLGCSALATAALSTSGTETDPVTRAAEEAE